MVSCLLGGGQLRRLAQRRWNGNLAKSRTMTRHHCKFVGGPAIMSLTEINPIFDSSLWDPEHFAGEWAIPELVIHDGRGECRDAYK